MPASKPPATISRRLSSVVITSGGGTYPQWGPDGRELFYISLDDKLMTVELKMGPQGIEPSTRPGP